MNNKSFPRDTNKKQGSGSNNEIYTFQGFLLHDNYKGADDQQRKGLTGISSSGILFSTAIVDTYKG